MDLLKLAERAPRRLDGEHRVFPAGDKDERLCRGQACDLRHRGEYQEPRDVVFLTVVHGHHRIAERSEMARGHGGGDAGRGCRCRHG